MNELQKIIAEMREYTFDVLHHWADRLDALAAQEPMAWSDLVEQRIRTWRQSFVNTSGDQLAIDDFMDSHSLDDLVDFVCDVDAVPPAQSGEVCEWTQSDDPDFCWWDTACGEAWVFTDGGPDENGCKFCPYCGRTLLARREET